MVCRQLRTNSCKDLLTRLDGCGKLPFAYDEKEMVYKEVRATETFTSPVKLSKEFDQDVDDDVRYFSMCQHYSFIFLFFVWVLFYTNVIIIS